MFKVRQNVGQEFGFQIMEIIDFELGLVENVIMQWEDDLGNRLIGKFSESQLTNADNVANVNSNAQQ
ncbi:hypothetical protein QO200_07790 [Flavobacterium sp. Arc3]|jgi:hypothetical protein|uniref:hypothetical protein n=1 Tax=Flavobacterium sp. Arc3 TaxID=3046686 RepID=UPI00352F34B1